MEELKYKNHLEISKKVFEDFISDMSKNFGDDEHENKKYLQQKLTEEFNIEHIRHDGIERLYTKIINYISDYDSGNIKFFKNEEILNYDFSGFENEINKLIKRSEKLEETNKKIIYKTEKKIKEKIENYLEGILSKLDEEKIFKDIKTYFDEHYSDIDINKENIELKQTLLQTMGKEHLHLSLVVEVDGKKVNIDILKNKKTGKIKKDFITKADKNLDGELLEGGDKKSGVIKKVYDNPNAGFELKPDYRLDKEKFNLEEDDYKNQNPEENKKVNFNESIREKIKEGEKDEELNVFIQVTKEWNKIFKKNKKVLNKEKNKNKRKEIISENAQKIANLFADNASLQGTVNFDNSAGSEGIKEYFEHFLAGSPTMRFSKINNIEKIEDGLLLVQGDYDFEVDNGEAGRKSLDANFNFYLEKNENTVKWGIKRLKSTFGKTEDNLKK